MWVRDPHRLHHSFHWHTSFHTSPTNTTPCSHCTTRKRTTLLKISNAGKQTPATPSTPSTSPPSTSNPSTPSLLPQAHAALLLADLSSLVTNIHVQHARYAEMDVANATDLIQSMKDCPALTATETEALDRPVLDADWRRIKGTITEPVEYFHRLRGGSGASTAAAWGKATTVIDAAAVTVFSYIWNYNSYERLRANDVKQKGRLREEIRLEKHSKIMIGTRLVKEGGRARLSGTRTILSGGGGLLSISRVRYGSISLST